MIKKQNVISSIDKKIPRYRITATLLNSWQRMFDAKLDVKESENDTICYEDKVSNEIDKRKEEFINILKRIPTPDNEYMKRGREFEEKVCSGLDEVFSPIVKDGAFQVTVTRDVDIDGIPLTLYGVLDVLKAGKIKDIKRVVRYKTGKYKNSHQHPMYLYLVPNAIDFEYLICDDKGDYHFERYLRENSEDILQVVSNFLSWLKANDLFHLFIQNWEMR